MYRADGQLLEKAKSYIWMLIILPNGVEIANKHSSWQYSDRTVHWPHGLAKLSTAPHEFSNSSIFANIDESNRIQTLLFELRIYGQFDSTKFANFEQVRELYLWLSYKNRLLGTINPKKRASNS